MQKLNEKLRKLIEGIISKVKTFKKRRDSKKKRTKVFKKVRKAVKRGLKKDKLIKIILALATLAMLLPLFLPFLG